MSCVTTLGDACWKLVSDFHWNFPCACFFFDGFAWYHCTVRNHSGEYDYMWSPVSPSESANQSGLLDADPVAMSHVSFDLHFPTDYRKHLFMSVFAICLSTLVKRLS